MSIPLDASALACERILHHAERIALRADRYPWDIPGGLVAYLEHVAATLADVDAETARVLPDPQPYGSAPSIPVGSAAYLKIVRSAAP